MEKRDMTTMAKAIGDPLEDFEAKFTYVDEAGDRILRPPCPMLNGNLCSIYADRPETCRTFPHLEKPNFISRLYGVIGAVSVCPIAFNVFEDLKNAVGWRRES